MKICHTFYCLGLKMDLSLCRFRACFWISLLSWRNDNNMSVGAEFAIWLGHTEGGELISLSAINIDPAVQSHEARKHQSSVRHPSISNMKRLIHTPRQYKLDFFFEIDNSPCEFNFNIVQIKTNNQWITDLSCCTSFKCIFHKPKSQTLIWTVCVYYCMYLYASEVTTLSITSELNTSLKTLLAVIF